MRVPITSSDAQNNWYLTEPFEYLCDAEQMDMLLRNILNFRLGAYIGPVDTDSFDAYGFQNPRLSLKLHMAPGTTNVLQDNGSIQPTDWPEGSVEIIVGAARNEYVDYVLYDGEVYTSSHFTL